MIDLGVGIYSAPEVARLTGLQTQRVRRWAEGRTVVAEGKRGRTPALFRPDLPKIDGHAALSFQDLVEVLFVQQFINAGVSMRTIREASSIAAAEMGTTHPFAMRQFGTDGQTIFHRFKQGRNVHMVDLIRRQFVFERVVSPLLKRLDYDTQTSHAFRWRPRANVSLDPSHSMGEPILTASGVPTRMLYGAHLAGEPTKAIAKWYDVPVAHVRNAIAFESERDGKTVRAAA